jgi:hypothetical protein
MARDIWYTIQNHYFYVYMQMGRIAWTLPPSHWTNRDILHGYFWLLSVFHNRDTITCGVLITRFRQRSRWYRKCFHCGGGFKNWRHTDNPWFEHATCSHTVSTFVTWRRRIRERIRKSENIELEMRTPIKLALTMLSLEQLSRVQSVELILCTSPAKCTYMWSHVRVRIRFGFSIFP